MSKQPPGWRKFLECTTEFESSVTADWLGAKNQDPNFGPENGALYAWSAIRDLFLKNSPRGLWAGGTVTHSGTVPFIERKLFH